MQFIRVNTVSKIGATRFELATFWSQTRRSTKLSYAPDYCCSRSASFFAPGCYRVYGVAAKWLCGFAARIERFLDYRLGVVVAGDSCVRAGLAIG